MIIKLACKGTIFKDKKQSKVLDFNTLSNTENQLNAEANQTEERFYAETDPFANATTIFDGVDANGSPNETEGALTEQYWTNNWARVAENLVMDASWQRMRYFYLSYKVSLKKCKIIDSSVLSLVGRNWLLFTNYLGIDPEANTFGPSSVPGFDAASIPASRSIELNFKIKF